MVCVTVLYNTYYFPVVTSICERHCIVYTMSVVMHLGDRSFGSTLRAGVMNYSALIFATVLVVTAMHDLLRLYNDFVTTRRQSCIANKK